VDDDLLTTPTTRRSVLRGGAGALGAVLLGTGLLGCSDDGDGGDAAATTTTSPADDAVPGEVDAGSGERPNAGDVDLAVAGVTFENTAVDLYRALLDQRSAELAAAGLVPLLERVRDHHVEHAASLNRFIRAQGLDPVPSDRLFPGVTPLEDDELAELAVPDLLALLGEREDQLTRSYVDTVPRLTHPPLRLLVATVGATEARHVAALDLQAGGAAAYLARAATLPAGRYPIEQSLLRG
jgi:hypothetical protein